MYAKDTALLTLHSATIAATAAGTEVDLQKYFVNPGKREMKAVFAPVLATSDSGGTLAYKLQHSTTTVDSDFSDISGGGFTTVTDNGVAKTPEQIHFYTKNRYVRGYATLSDSTTWSLVAMFFAVKRDA